MKKMFLVFTSPNCLDTTVAVDAPRLITVDPVKAIECARRVYKERTSIYIDRVCIYKLDMEKEYELYDYLKPKVDENLCLVAFKKSSGDDGWAEKFYGDFEEILQVS